MTDRSPKPRYTDNAFRAEKLKGGSPEATFSGALSFMRRRYTRDLRGVDAVVWGIPYDAATSYRPGARFGPQAIRRASALFDGDPQYPFGFDIFDELAVIDYGDAGFDYGRYWEFVEVIEAQAGEILASGAFLLTLGGDHFVTWPLLKAHAARYGPLALVQFDAHQDSWEDDGERLDHGTFVARAVRQGVIDPARSIQIGIRTVAPADFGIEIVHPHEIDGHGPAAVAERVLARVGGARAYLSFDIDGLDPAFAPGTGTPVAGGLTTREALAVMRALGALDIVGADVVEVAPPYDHGDITAIAGADIARHCLGLLAERRRRERPSSK